MEDSRGPDAFAYLKKVYNAKRRTKDMKETMKWYEETFDPAGFTKEVQCQWDKDKINSVLLKLSTRAIDDMDEDEDEDEDESESDIEADAEIKAETHLPFLTPFPLLKRIIKIRVCVLSKRQRYFQRFLQKGSGRVCEIFKILYC
jgi:hypothetical protein